MEGLEESANSLAENLIDKLTGYDPNRKLMDNVAQSFVLGFTSSLHMQSPVYALKAGLHVKNEFDYAKNKQDVESEFKSQQEEDIPDVTPKTFTKGYDTNDQAQMSNVEQETKVEQTKDTTENKKPSENLPTKEETEQLIEKHLGKKKETPKTENKEETKAPEKKKESVDSVSNLEETKKADLPSEETVKATETKPDKITSPTEQKKSEAEQTSINPTQKTAGESSAPGGEKVKTNPYLKMPIERVKEDAKNGVELAKKALRERRGEVDPGLVKAKEKLNQQLDKRIDRAVEVTKLEKRLDHVNKKIESQEKAPQNELIKIKVQEKLNEQFDSIEVGDKIDVGGNNLLTVTKKNRKSVVTQGGSKWSANEIGKVIKNKAEAKQQEQQKQKPDTKKIQKLRKTAQAMDKQIDAKLNPAVAQQNPTARRASIASNMEAEGRKLQKVQRTLNELAQMHEDGSIPEHLKNISTKAEVETILNDAVAKERKYNYRQVGWFRKEPYFKLQQAIKGKKGAVEIRSDLAYLPKDKNGYGYEVSTDKQIKALEKALNLAGDKLDKWDKSSIRDGIRKAKRYKGIGAKNKA